MVEMLEGSSSIFKIRQAMLENTQSNMAFLRISERSDYVWMGRKLGHGASVHILSAARYYNWLQPSDKKIWGVAYLSKISDLWSTVA